MQCHCCEAAFPARGRVGRSSPKSLVLIYVSLGMLFFSHLGDCQAVKERRVQKMFIGPQGQALGTIRMKCVVNFLHALSSASVYEEYRSAWSYYTY